MTGNPEAIRLARGVGTANALVRIVAPASNAEIIRE